MIRVGNYMTIMDDRNAMERHYKKLWLINSNKGNLDSWNDRFMQRKRVEARLPVPKVKKARNKQIQQDNQKMMKALDEINSKWGDLSPVMLQINSFQGQGTMGFKPKSKKMLINENMEYLDKIQKVKPVYQKQIFKAEEKEYKRIKRNMDNNLHNHRLLITKSMKCNTAQLKVADHAKEDCFESHPGYGFSETQGLMSMRPNSAKAASLRPIPGPQLSGRPLSAYAKNAAQFSSSKALFKRPSSAMSTKFSQSKSRPQSGMFSNRLGGITGRTNANDERSKPSIND